MARPTKSGLDYFPLQTDIFTTGSDLAPLLNRFDGLGLLVYIHILCDVYQNGYYLKVPFMDDYKASIRKNINCSEDVVNGSIDLLKRLGILVFIDEEGSVVITSKGIQKRYLEVINRNRSLDKFLKNFKNEYCLLSDDEIVEKCPKLTKNGNLDINREFADGKTPFTDGKAPFSGDKPTEKCTNKSFLSFPFISAGSEDYVNEKLCHKEVGDEFERETEREKRERELEDRLGLNPKLERARPDDPPAKGPSDFDSEGYRRFVTKWGVSLVNTQNYSGVIYEIKWDELSRKIEQSRWVRERLSMDFVLRNYAKIMNGRFDDYENPLDALKRVVAKMDAEEAAQNGDTE